MMEGEPAGPSSSVGARRPWAVGRCWPCVLAGHPWGVVLSVGVCHVWVVRCRCIWEGHHRLWGVLVVRACVVVVVRGWGFFCPWALLVVGVVVRGWGLFSVAGHCRLWALGGRFDRGWRSSFVGVGCRLWGWLVVLGGWVIDCGGWGSFA